MKITAIHAQVLRTPSTRTAARRRGPDAPRVRTQVDEGQVGFGLEDDIAIMRAIRAARGERRTTPMIDTNEAYGEADAIRLGRARKAYALRWHEEPVVPENLAGYRKLGRLQGIEVNPHVWRAGVAQRASLHLIASLPVADRSPFQREPAFEYDSSTPRSARLSSTARCGTSTGGSRSTTDRGSASTRIATH